MKSPCNSTQVANDLITWMRQYAPLHIDSYLIDEQKGFPPHIFLDLGNQGFFGMHISRQYGGLELKTFDMLRILEQIAAVDLTLAVVLVESIQGAHTLTNYGSKIIIDTYLNQLATGRIFTAGAMTESAAGSNPRAMESNATPTKNGWLLNGSKRWVGMGSSADLTAIYAQQFDSENNWVGMSGFLVPKGAKGLHIGPAASTMGMRGFSKNIIYMNNIEVSPEFLLGKPGEGMEIAQNNMMYVRLCLGAASVGAMKRCLQLMFRYAQRRVVATGKLLDNPVTLVRLSEMTAITDAIDNFIYLVATCYDKDSTTVPEEAFVVSKILGSEYLTNMTDSLVQMLGARGYEEGSGVAKLFRDARVFRIFEGPTEALNMYIGSRVLVENKLLERFFYNTLNQKKLFQEIKETLEQINQHCLQTKSTLFHTPFALNYWAQSLAGEVICYGLLLGALECSLVDKTDRLARAALWAREKYNDIVKKSLAFSLGENVLLQSDELHQIVTSYLDTIGDIDQTRDSQGVSVDDLLRRMPPALDAHEKHELFSKELSDKQLYHDASTFVTGEEREILLYDWNNIINKTNYSSYCTHQLFENQATLNPQSVAVVFGDQSISYQELNTKANKVARALRQEGIGPNQLVAIYLERSIEMIIALLGIFKAGGAYLPLDTNYPEKTLKFMFEDSLASMVISHTALSNDTPFDSKNTIFIDDILKHSISENQEKNTPTTSHLDDIGYIIYTSGSTGNPKGVKLPHKALANLIQWHNGLINDSRNVLQFTTLNFDMSFIEIFSALCSGGTLVLIAEHDRTDLLTFAKIIQKNAVQQLVLSVPFLKNLIQSKIDITYFSQLKEIIIAGEQLVITPTITSFFDKLPSCKLLNYYGPSETHVVTAYEFPEKTKEWPDYPPIGKAIANTKIMLLDDNKKLVPIGATGEIYIGGASLAKEYVNRSELTHEKFIQDPWSDNPDDHLYRTGDFAKYLPDGNLVYLGRKDEQVKIRGFRIEPQEIEWHLLQYPNVKEAVVIAKKGVNESKHLEAFMVMEGDIDEAHMNNIHIFLQEHLPSHMIPSIFHVIERIPLTNSGKVNRNELEKYDHSISYAVHNTIDPTSNTEKELIDIIEGIFNYRIGINHSFRAVGGNSLLAMQVVSMIREKFLVDIPSYYLLSDSTIGETAKRVDSAVLAKTEGQ